MSCLLLLLLLQGMVPWELVPHAVQPGEEGVAHSAPCPDAGPDGDPCAPGCACLCCPGHARVIPTTVALLPCFVHHRQLEALSLRVHAFELASRVYRPPRAA